MNRFVLTVTAILAAAYLYLASRLASSTGAQLALALPFLLVWIVPVVYWGSDRDRYGAIDQGLHFARYLSMGWVSFALVLAAVRDALLLATSSLPVLVAVPVASLDLGVP